MQHILLIDTSYFAHRVLGQLNMGENINNLVTPTEQNRFVNELRNSLVNLYQTFNNDRFSLIDQIVMCCDSKSWRKELEPFKPYWWTEFDQEKPLGYKEQRVEKKEASSINYDNFYPLIDRFLSEISDKVTVCKVNGLEGDDTMMLMVRKIYEQQNTRCLIFCTDGDIEQLVNDKTIVFRNIHSKEVPNGEFVMNLSTYERLCSKSKMDMFLGNNLEIKYYQDLFSICIGDNEGKTKIKRSLNTGISLGTPFKTLLLKSIGGDKKDNIFSVISWLSTTGTRRYKVTDKHLEKAFAANKLSMTEADCKKVFFDKSLLTKIIENIALITKQKIPTDRVMEHLKHNIRLNVLSPTNIPTKYFEAFQEWFRENEVKIFKTNLEPNQVRELYIQQNYRPKEYKGDNVLETALKGLL